MIEKFRETHPGKLSKQVFTLVQLKHRAKAIHISPLNKDIHIPLNRHLGPAVEFL